MAVYLQCSIGGKLHPAGTGALRGLKLGPKTLTPNTLSFQIGVPRSGLSASSGAASGKSKDPIVITKETDSASPLIWSALRGNHVIPKLKINFLSTNGKGNTQPYFTIELTNASLASYSRGFFLPGNVKHSSNANTHELEKLAFSYQKIEYTGGNSSQSAQDDWTS
jgi:type VI secretion system secreted protein Hcp